MERSTPASFMVGMSGYSGTRRSAATPRTRTFFASRMVLSGARISKSASMWPPASATVRSPPPRKGTSVTSIPAFSEGGGKDLGRAPGVDADPHLARIFLGVFDVVRQRLPAPRFRHGDHRRVHVDQGDQFIVLNVGRRRHGVLRGE